MTQPGMKNCRFCGTEIDAMAIMCPKCGKMQGKEKKPLAKNPVAITAIGVVGFFVIIIIIGSIISATKTTEPEQPKAEGAAPTVRTETQGATAPAATPVQQQSTPVAQEDKYPNFKDGNYIVGTDIQPGTYRTRTSSSGCYYARLSGFSGSLEEIIANENANGPAVIMIAPTDKGFKSSRCGTWTQDLSAITTSPTSFGDGIYIVGTDIQPGTYKSTGGSGCYYARLNGFTGTLDDILANENTDGPAIVTIAVGDKGFKSARCGTWSKVS